MEHLPNKIERFETNSFETQYISESKYKESGCSPIQSLKRNMKTEVLNTRESKENICEPGSGKDEIIYSRYNNCEKKKVDTPKNKRIQPDLRKKRNSKMI